jgi:integrating conjugative element protein (TIGR03749 family)
MCRTPEMKMRLPVGFIAALLLATSAAAGPIAPSSADTAAVPAAAPPDAPPDATPATVPPAAPAKPDKARTRKPAHHAAAEAPSTARTGGVTLETTDAPAPSAPLAPPALAVAGVEHVRFERRPVVVVVEIGRERLVHFPYEVAIHQPDPMPDPLTVQLIGSTAYLNATAPIHRLRLVAEGLDGQGMIPMDVVVRTRAPSVPDELEILVANAASRAGHGHAGGDGTAESGDDETDPPDLVQLSRYCSQMLYAPQRLIKPVRGVRQVDVRVRPVPRLYRGSAVITTPIAAWRARALYVTAVRFTNRTNQPVELDMDELRGRWVAATPQHWRLLPQGSEADTTAVCLISEQAFDAARP